MLMNFKLSKSTENLNGIGYGFFEQQESLNREMRNSLVLLYNWNQDRKNSIDEINKLLEVQAEQINALIDSNKALQLELAAVKQQTKNSNENTALETNSSKIIEFKEVKIDSPVFLEGYKKFG